MTLDPLIEAPFIVQAHVATVIPAFFLGVWLLVFSRKGLRWHRLLGAVFLTLMVTTAILALFIHRRMPGSPVFGMSPTHLFVPFVLFATWRALDGAFNGNIKQHQRWVMGLFFGALVINGVHRRKDRKRFGRSVLAVVPYGGIIDVLQPSRTMEGWG